MNVPAYTSVLKFHSLFEESLSNRKALIRILTTWPLSNTLRISIKFVPFFVKRRREYLRSRPVSAMLTHGVEIFIMDQKWLLANHGGVLTVLLQLRLKLVGSKFDHAWFSPPKMRMHKDYRAWFEVPPIDRQLFAEICDQSGHKPEVYAN